MNTCRFELRIKNTSFFQCAAMPHGWAYLWKHNRLQDPCPCPRVVEGEPLIIDHELKSAEFWEIGGKRIREEDWNKWLGLEKDND